jgi:hypothetical protein
MDTDPRGFQRQTIDAKIKSLEESIRKLRSHRNTLAPISSLPIELIRCIFSYLRVPGRPPPFARGEKQDPLAWLRVAHVCHQWREIALNHPLFWSYVNFSDLKLAGATEILARAKNVPLYLEASIPYVRWSNSHLATFEEEIQRRVSRIRHLGISATHLHLSRTLEGLVSPAPILEYLSLTCEKHWPRTSSLPVTLFSGITPRLSRLALRNCDISWESPLLKRLTYLEICTPTRSARPGLADWLDSLEEMSRLKTLILHYASPIAPFGSSPPFEVERTITLPFLTHLGISASPWDCALALAHLCLPSLAHLSVTTRSRNDSELQRILPYVTLHAHGPQDTQTPQSMLIHTKDTYFDILAWTEPDINFDVRDSSAFLDAMLSARVILSITIWKSTSSVDTHTRMFDAAMAALPLDNLVTLISPNCTLSELQVWRRHEPQWRLLQHVHLGLFPAGFFKMILLEGSGEYTRPLLPSLLLPSLTTLALVDSIVTESWIRRICDILIRRVELGVPLEVVDLRTCDVTDHAAIEQLTKLGVDVWAPTEGSSGKPDFDTCYSEARGVLNPDKIDPN